MGYYKKFENAPTFSNWSTHILDCIQKRKISGLVLEFGVHKGRSINYIAKLIKPDIVHGFDSFEGLPEKWIRRKDETDTYQPGTFKLKEMPVVEDNVVLYKGWFKDTIPEFLKNNSENVSFINVDCDIYSSCKDVLFLMNKRIVKGTIIRFDEMFDWGNAKIRYDTWPDHEYKAMKEWIKKFKRKIHALSRDFRYGSAIIVKK